MGSVCFCPRVFGHCVACLYYKPCSEQGLQSVQVSSCERNVGRAREKKINPLKKNRPARRKERFLCSKCDVTRAEGVIVFLLFWHIQSESGVIVFNLDLLQQVAAVTVHFSPHCCLLSVNCLNPHSAFVPL